MLRKIKYSAQRIKLPAREKRAGLITGFWTFAGFGVLDAAAIEWHRIVGLCAIGVTCLILGWLVESE